MLEVQARCDKCGRLLLSRDEGLGICLPCRYPTKRPGGKESRERCECCGRILLRRERRCGTCHPCLALQAVARRNVLSTRNPRHGTGRTDRPRATDRRAYLFLLGEEVPW